MARKEITVSEVKRFRADHRHVVETEFDDAQFVGVADFDRVTAERDAERRRADVAVADANAADAAGKKVSELLSNRTAERDALQALLTAADERADVLEGLLRQVSASCALTWEDHQPTADTLELQDLIDAALKPAEGGGDD